MDRQKSQLEDLPNELLTEIFKNLDARALFRAFHRLNTRLNQLIQCFEYLQLFFHINASNVLKTNDEIFSYYVHTLVVNPWINFNLQHFPNVRCLRLDNPLPKVVEQLQPKTMPYLEYLSVSYTYNMYEMVILHENIFSNRFPKLKSCELREKNSLMTIPNWTQSPSIKALKTEFIDAIIYKTILYACPNLYYLKFSLYPSNGIPIGLPLHHDLKYMIVELQDSDWYFDDHTLYRFLESVPNLEKFEIHRKSYSHHIKEYVQYYDWLASIIEFRLPVLRRFTFYFNLLKDENPIGCIDENLWVQIKRNFNHAHKGSYTSQLLIGRE